MHKGRPAPPRHSGPWVGALVASLRCRVLRPGVASINSHGPTREKSLLERPPARYNYSCSGSASLAGFEVTTYGRFSGDHRGPVDLFNPPTTVAANSCSRMRPLNSTNGRNSRRNVTSHYSSLWDCKKHSPRARSSLLTPDQCRMDEADSLVQAGTARARRSSIFH